MDTDLSGPAGAQGHSLERRVTDLIIRLGFLGLFIGTALMIVAPFLSVIVWAIILTVAQFPFFVWLRGLLGGRSGLAATIITLIGLGVLLGPAAGLMLSLADSVALFFASVRDGTVSVPPPPADVADWPLIGEQVHGIWAQASTNLEEVLQTHSAQVIAAGKLAAGQIAGVGIGILLFAASIIIAGFLFSSGIGFVDKARSFSVRVVGERGAEFVDLAGATIRNVSRGVIGVSIIQSLLAGIVMAVAGVPAAGVVAAITLLLCIVQIGPALTIIPAIIWAWNVMETTGALIFTVVMIPIMLLDNVLKPIWMARGLKTPMLVILIGVIGGTLSLGLLGLFIGPIVLAVFYELLVAWVRIGDPAERAQSSE